MRPLGANRMVLIHVSVRPPFVGVQVPPLSVDLKIPPERVPARIVPVALIVIVLTQPAFGPLHDCQEGCPSTGVADAVKVRKMTKANLILTPKPLLNLTVLT